MVTIGNVLLLSLRLGSRLATQLQISDAFFYPVSNLHMHSRHELDLIIVEELSSDRTGSLRQQQVFLILSNSLCLHRERNGRDRRGRRGLVDSLSGGMEESVVTAALNPFQQVT